MTNGSFLIKLQKSIGTPSSSAQNNLNSWKKIIKTVPANGLLICHRDPSETCSVPVSLLSPIFTQFIYDLDNIDITPKDCEFVSKLCISMCGAFGSEKERTKEFTDFLKDYTGLLLGSEERNQFKTDGSLKFANGALYCYLEVKVDKGTGNVDPYMQNIAYYIRNLGINEAISTQYPCFLLELCGTAFSVCGAVNTEQNIICDPLSPTYQLFCNQEFMFTQKITKLFASLRKSLLTLHEQGIQGLLSPPTSFPYLSSFPDRIKKNKLSGRCDTNREYRDLYSQPSLSISRKK